MPSIGPVNSRGEVNEASGKAGKGRRDSGEVVGTKGNVLALAAVAKQAAEKNARNSAKQLVAVRHAPSQEAP